MSDEREMGEVVEAIPRDGQWHEDIVPGYRVRWEGEWSWIDDGSWM